MTAAHMPAMPPARRRAPAGSGAPATMPNHPFSASILLALSYTRNCVPRCGATFKQLAPLPLKSPRMPSLRHASFNSGNIPLLSPPLHIISVATISIGAQAVREMTPATAPATMSLRPLKPATWLSKCTATDTKAAARAIDGYSVGIPKKLDSRASPNAGSGGLAAISTGGGTETSGSSGLPRAIVATAPDPRRISG